MPDQFNEAEARAELERLRAKQAAIDDEDIRLALQARIDALESQLIQKPAPAIVPEPEPLPQTTPRTSSASGSVNQAVQSREDAQTTPSAP